MTIAKASSKHQIVIPKTIRIKLKLKPKQKFSIEVKNGGILMKPLPASIDEIAGCATSTFAKYGGGKKYYLKERKKWNK